MTTEIKKAPASSTNTHRPYYRVLSGEETHTVEVFMPGVAKGEYHVSLQNHELLVEGGKALSIPTEAKWLHREIPTADYKLRLQLNVDIDADNIGASSEHGVLRITLPVAAAARPRRIKIQ